MVDGGYRAEVMADVNTASCCPNQLIGNALLSV